MSLRSPSDPESTDSLQITYALRSYGLQVDSATLVSGGFSGAEVYRVQADDGGTYALRYTPRHVALPLLRLKQLHQFLRGMQQAGLSVVPVPIPDKSGETVLLGPMGYWQLEPWMPGAALSAAELSDAHVSRAIDAICQFHEAAATCMLDFPANEWFRCTVNASPAVSRRLQIVTTLRNGEMDELFREAKEEPDAEFRDLALTVCSILRSRLPGLERQLRSVNEMLFVLQPVFRDLWSSHILFTDVEVTGIIDATACGTDHILVDLTRLQRSWYGAENVRVRWFIEQFASRRPISVNEYSLLRSLDESSVLLSPVTWLRRQFANRTSLGPRTASETLPQVRLNGLSDVKKRLGQLVQVLVDFQPL
jgi:Ser/Thr protein kinase RdoA (MazF antagonist)